MKGIIEPTIKDERKMAKSLLLILCVYALVGSLLVAVVSIEPVKAFCLFNCAAEDLKNRLQVHADCLQTQILAGASGRTAYDTEDLSSDGKILTIKGVQYTEEELRKEWKENPDKHSSNCYFVGDVTPQEVERVYQESLK